MIASDVNVCGLAGLFHIDWLLPGYQPDFCVPGQTLDQLRDLTPLTPPQPAGLIVSKPTHNAKYWARVTKGMDFSDADRVDPAQFNRVLWKGLMGKKPYPASLNGTHAREEGDDEHERGAQPKKNTDH